MNTLKIITSAAVEPLTLEEVKLHLKVETDADDNLITSLITAARETAEVFTGRAIASQVLEYILDCFPDSSDVIYPVRPWRNFPV